MIETSTEIIEFSDGIVFCRLKKGINMSLEEGKENMKAISEVTNGVRSPVFVDITESKGISKDCRNLFTSEEVADIQSAVAMLVDSAFTKMIANFFIGLNKTPFPLKMFKDRNEAINWLSQYK